MKFLRALIFGTFIFIGAAAAGAQGMTLSFSSLGAPPAISYTSDTYVIGTGTLTVTNNSRKQQPYFFTCYTPVNSRKVSNGIYSIPIYVYKHNVQPYATIQPWDASLSENDVVFGTLNRYATLTDNYDVYVPAGYWVPKGTYTGTLQFELDNGYAGDDNRQGNRMTTNVSVLVDSAVGLSLLTSGASYIPGALSANLDFGTLAPGNTQSLNAVVRANTSWTLSVTALSGGNLKYTSGTGEVFQISYSLYFNRSASPTSLTAGSATLLSNQSWTSAGDQSYQLKFVIGAFDTVDPGTYSDAVTIQLTAN
jgi:hypothetical protein